MFPKNFHKCVVRNLYWYPFPTIYSALQKFICENQDKSVTNFPQIQFDRRLCKILGVFKILENITKLLPNLPKAKVTVLVHNTFDA